MTDTSDIAEGVLNELQEENEQASNNHIQEKVEMIREHSHWKERAIEEIDKLKKVIDELKVKR